MQTTDDEYQPAPCPANVGAVANGLVPGDDDPFSLYYLATPYTNAPGGHEHAHRIACITAANLIKIGIPVFSPIAHGHSIAEVASISGTADAWKAINEPILKACNAVIVALIPGWDKSEGIQREIAVAEEYFIPVWYMDVDGGLSLTPPAATEASS